MNETMDREASQVTLRKTCLVTTKSQTISQIAVIYDRRNKVASKEKEDRSAWR